MLVLARRHGEQILLGDNVVIQVLSVTRGRVKVGIKAPDDMPIRRSKPQSKDEHVQDNFAPGVDIALLAGEVH